MASPDAEVATSGLWCEPPAALTATLYGLVVVPVKPAARTVAGELPWMSSHTTENATAVGLFGAPSGSTATLGWICWPSVFALARPEPRIVPVGERTR